MELSGPWLAHIADDALRRKFADNKLDVKKWTEIAVPGHWQNTSEFSNFDGPLFYRTSFNAKSPKNDRRSWLEFDGIFSLGDIWIDDHYLGTTEGYFFTHALEVTEQLKQRDEHVLAIEVTSPPVLERQEQRVLTGSAQGFWNPGGIWQPVRIRETGAVPLRHVRVICTQASPTVATLALRAVVHTNNPQNVVFRTMVLGVDHRHQQPLAAGENRVEWTIRIPQPKLWWPKELGEQPLFDLTLTVSTEDGAISDKATRQLGFRSIQMKNHIWNINGEQLFLRGAIVPPLKADLANVDVESALEVIKIAQESGLNLLRVGAHVSHPTLYQVADKAGMLLWQDMPLIGRYHHSVRHQATRQAREMVDFLGHHPSIVVWCGHDTPDPTDTTKPIKSLIDQQRPSWNRTILDRSIRRTLKRTDPSRPVLAHTGVLPSRPFTEDAAPNLRFGWYNGSGLELGEYLKRNPRHCGFIAAFGSHSVPASNFRLLGLDPDRWPNLDWRLLISDPDSELAVLLRRFHPLDFTHMSDWVDATQLHQAEILRLQIEILRRNKYKPCGGFAIDRLLDPRPCISGSLIDHDGKQKPAFTTVSSACAQTIIVADPLPQPLRKDQNILTDITIIHDGRNPLLTARVDANLTFDSSGTAEKTSETFTWSWEGQVASDSSVYVGRIKWPVRQATGDVKLDLLLSTEDTKVTNQYVSTILNA